MDSDCFLRFSLVRFSFSVSPFFHVINVFDVITASYSTHFVLLDTFISSNISPLQWSPTSGSEERKVDIREQLSNVSLVSE